MIQVYKVHVGMLQWRTLSFSDFSGFDDLNLSINTDMATVVKAMAQPDSGLEIRDRMWLKITIPNAFIGWSQYM